MNAVAAKRGSRTNAHAAGESRSSGQSPRCALNSACEKNASDTAATLTSTNAAAPRRRARWPFVRHQYLAKYPAFRIPQTAVDRSCATTSPDMSKLRCSLY